MTVQFVALGIFVAVFAIAAIRNVNIGIVMFPVAAAVGLGLAHMKLADVVGEFPLDILVLLVGVTYFFGIAHSNGTVDWLIEAAVARVKGRDRLYPLVFFVLTGVISAMGAPLGGLVMAPVGMSLAHRRRIDPAMMALAMGCGLSAGAFLPTSLFGIITWGTARSAGIDFNPMLLALIAIVFNLILLVGAYTLFGRKRPPQAGTAAVGTAAASTSDDATAPVERGSHDAGAHALPHGPALPSYAQSSLDVHADVHDLVPDRPPRPSRMQALTLLAVAALVGTVVAISLTGGKPDIGVLGFAFAALLAVLDPAAGKSAMTRIDWGSVLLVGGIVTYVGVLTELGVLDMVGEGAAKAAVPLLAAFLLCAAAGLISAFASTTGMLAALVPLALPLVRDSAVPGWALICAIGVCASIVDVSPFSTIGATYVAAADEADRPRLTRILMRGGLSMILIGPIALTLVLILPGIMGA